MNPSFCYDVTYVIYAMTYVKVKPRPIFWGGKNAYLFPMNKNIALLWRWVGEGLEFEGLIFRGLGQLAGADLAPLPSSAPPGFSFSEFLDSLDWIFGSRAGLGARHWLFPMGHNGWAMCRADV